MAGGVIMMNQTAVYCWGNTADGQLGLGGIEEEQIFGARDLAALRGRQIKEISTGVNHTLFVMTDGTVYSCGNNDHGQLGHEKPRRKPEQIDTLETQIVTQVSCGWNHSASLNNRGQVFTWGNNQFGQLGRQVSDESAARTPKMVKQLSNYRVVQIACGHNHTLALTDDSYIFSWGSNEHGQTGLSNAHMGSNVIEPQCITSLNGLAFTQIVAGGKHSFALTVSGCLFGWGLNRNGQLGVGDHHDRPFPSLCKTLRSQKVKYVTCGENHSAVLTQDGGVFTFGAGMYGQLGHCNMNSEFYPKKVFELMGSEVTMLACGRSHTFAFVRSSGKLYTCGLGGNGQLGINARSNKDSPVLVQTPMLVPPNVGTNVMMKVVCIFAGGDQCFVTAISATALVQPCDFRHPIASRQISLITVDVAQRYMASEYPREEDAREIKKLFSSLGCLNGSFLKPDDQHFFCDKKNHGVDSLMARQTFDLIQKTRCPQIKAMVEMNLEQLLIRCVTTSPPDIEALRFFLSLPFTYFFLEPIEFLGSIVCPFGRAVVSLDKAAAKVIDLWWGEMDKQFQLDLINAFKRVLLDFVSRPKIPGNSNPNPEIAKHMYTCLEILSKLYAINETKRLVDNSTFYIDNMHTRISLDTDYVVWCVLEKQFSTQHVLTHEHLPANYQMQPRPFCSYPFIFDGQAKTYLLHIDAYFQMRHAIEEVHQRNFTNIFPSFLLGTGGAPIDPVNPCLILMVARDNIVQDTINQLTKQAQMDFKKPLKVIFLGEEALDAGGVKKEFFLLLLKELLDPKYGMFEYFEESRLVWFNPMSFESHEMYQLIGVACGLAIYNGIIININIPEALFKKLLRRQVTIDDLKELQPTIARSMQELLAYEGDDFESIYGLSFETTKERYGQVVTVELKPGGSSIPVNQENKHEFVSLFIDYLFNESVKEQFENFSRGFHKVCGGKILELFQPHELQAMVVGNENYDWNELQKITEYKEPYRKDDPTIQLFWEVFHELPLEDKKKFLLFLTGCDRIPILGMKAVKLIIQPMNVVDNFLPVAHTCFNVLDLPRYTDKEHLRRKLLQAIEHTQGFGKRPLSQKSYKRLKRNKRLLILTIKWTKYVSNEVQKRNILTKTDLDNILYRRTPSEKKAALLDAIMRRSEEDLETLKQILERAKQETAAKLLYEDDIWNVKHLIKNCNSSATPHGEEEEISRAIRASYIDDREKSGERGIVLVGSDPGGSIVVHFFLESVEAAKLYLSLMEDGKLREILEDVICEMLKNCHEAPVTIKMLRTDVHDEIRCRDYIRDGDNRLKDLIPSCSRQKDEISARNENRKDMKNSISRAQIIKDNEEVLIRSIDPNVSFMARLSSDDVLDEESLQEIEAEATAAGKNKRLLQILLGCLRDDFKQFVGILQEEKQEHIANLLIGKTEGPQFLSSESYEKLKRTNRILVQKIVWSEMLYVKLKSADILNDTDYERIESKEDLRDKKIELIQAIMRRSEDDVRQLKEIFQQLEQLTVAKILSGGHVMTIHLDTSRPEDDKKISDLLNLSEVKIADQCEMRGCSILQWQAQLQVLEVKKRQSPVIVNPSQERMQISESFDQEDFKYSNEKNSGEESFLETSFGSVAAQIIENISNAMIEVHFKLMDGTTKMINGFLLKIPAEGNIEIEGLLTNHLRVPLKECNEALDCSIRSFGNKEMSPLVLSLGSCEYIFNSEELNATFFQFPLANIEVLRKANMQWLSVKSQVKIGEQIFFIQEPEIAPSYGTNVMYGNVREISKNEQSHWFLGDMVGRKPSSMGSPVVTFDGRLVGVHCGVSSDGRVRVTHAKSILDAILADFNQIDMCSTPQRTSRKRKLPEVNTDQQVKRSKILYLYKEFLLRSLDCNPHLLSRLCSAGIIGNKTRLEIDAEKTQMRRNKRLLQQVCIFTSDDYEKFIEILREEKQEHVANLMIEDTTGKRPLSSHNYDRLKQNKRRLIEEIRWSDILFKSLKDMGVFASADYTRMESKLNSFEKKAVLIDALMRRSEEDFEMFQQALVQQGQENIAHILSRDSGEERGKSSINCDVSRNTCDLESEDLGFDEEPNESRVKCQT